MVTPRRLYFLVFGALLVAALVFQGCATGPAFGESRARRAAPLARPASHGAAKFGRCRDLTRVGFLLRLPHLAHAEDRCGDPAREDPRGRARPLRRVAAFRACARRLRRPIDELRHPVAQRLQSERNVLDRAVHEEGRRAAHAALLAAVDLLAHALQVELRLPSRLRSAPGRARARSRVAAQMRSS